MAGVAVTQLPSDDDFFPNIIHDPDDSLRLNKPPALTNPEEPPVVKPNQQLDMYRIPPQFDAARQHSVYIDR